MCRPPTAIVRPGVAAGVAVLAVAAASGQSGSGAKRWAVEGCLPLSRGFLAACGRCQRLLAIFQNQGRPATVQQLCRRPSPRTVASLGDCRSGLGNQMVFPGAMSTCVWGLGQAFADGEGHAGHPHLLLLTCAIRRLAHL